MIPVCKSVPGCRGSMALNELPKCATGSAGARSAGLLSSRLPLP